MERLCQQFSRSAAVSSQIPNPASLAIIILAGGRSKRMGRDKAMIEVDGTPLIQRIYDVVASCQIPPQPTGEGERLPPQIYVLTPWIDRYRSILPITCNFILEQQPDHGPLSAFAQGLTEITATWIMLIACDLPNLSTSIIQAGIDRLPSIPAQSIAYLPKQIEKGWEPLCGFYRQICQPSAIAYINGGGKSFQDWLKPQIVTEFIITDPTCLLNCNTPADLAMILNTKQSALTPKTD
jgi:molybdenum cofactor guanylyltransferase